MRCDVLNKHDSLGDEKFAGTAVYFLTAFDVVELQQREARRQEKKESSRVYSTGTIVNYKPLLRLK